MINRKHKLSMMQQCRLLGVSRSSLYYRARPTSQSDLDMMRKIDELHLEHPFAGSRMLRRFVRRDGHNVGRRHVGTLMRKMGIHALYRKPNTSKRHPGHKVYPYLLRNLEINRSNHVWAADITYIPMKKGSAYLFAVMDWSSRKVLTWQLSNTMSADFCIEAVQDAFKRFGTPEIFNTDQGSQFTSEGFTTLLKDNGVRISMDGKGCWRDNVFVERLWKSIKYEEVYLKAYDSMPAARRSLGIYMDFYNSKRPHSSLDDTTPDEVYFNGWEILPNAA